jgi:hypothetical protein
MDEAVCSLHVERVRGPCKYLLASDWMVGVVCVLGATQEVLLDGCGGWDPTGRVELLRGPCQQVEQFQHLQQAPLLGMMMVSAGGIHQGV